MAHTGEAFPLITCDESPSFRWFTAKSSLTSEGPRIVNLLRRGHMRANWN